MAYPEWVEKQKRPGTNITVSKGKYYLYACKSVYDKEKKRSRKITGAYLGRITEEGLIPPKAKQTAEGKYRLWGIIAIPQCTELTGLDLCK